MSDNVESERPNPRSHPRMDLIKHDTRSNISIAGHPLHAMSVHFPIALVFATLGIDVFYWFFGDPFFLRAGVWSAGFAFGMGVVAALIGIAELLAVKGIRTASRVGRTASQA